ncbi:acyl-CoA dehydrogenase family protein [Marisediminicola senii]|uniref:acyl-CoA dehydrogenase n=1 Tax=Marisediminicola senii TaxID=2711233 RepID=UPI001F3A7DC3|nr:acyl-CoA dehydrogenase [Marisediminicola senii]
MSQSRIAAASLRRIPAGGIEVVVPDGADVPTSVDTPESLEALAGRTAAATGDIAAALQLAVELGRALQNTAGPQQVLDSWEALATIAATDLTVARAVEPHLDALAILAELGQTAGAHPDLAHVGVDATSTWGVFAAEAPGHGLTATRSGDGWRIDGSKAWCSLAGRLSHALVTAVDSAAVSTAGDGTAPASGAAPGGTVRRLFAVDLRHAGVTVDDSTWVAKGLSEIPSGPVRFDGVAAVPVGAAGWYLERTGFAWGGIGVAAVWWGGALGVARAIDRRVRSGTPDQIALMHLGGADVSIETGRLALLDAAAQVDAAQVDASAHSTGHGEPAQRAAARILALRTRTIVAGAAEDILRRAAHALGPSPLALDPVHAARVADLELYIRQHHAERDESALGSALRDTGAQSW